MKRTTQFIVQGAAIAAIYFLLTYAIAPISSGLLQCRVSEALCVLPYFTPAAIPGLFIGCVIANLLTGAVLLDVLLGSAATLLAAITTWWLKKHLPAKPARLLAPVPAIVFNAFIVGWLLFAVYEVGVPYAVCALYVGAGQMLACYGVGLPLLLLLERYQSKLFGSISTPSNMPKDY